MIIKIEELRFGNWVQDSNGNLCKFICLDIDAHNDNIWVSIGGIGIRKMPIANISPVLLTEEVLIDCGFWLYQEETVCNYPKSINPITTKLRRYKNENALDSNGYIVVDLVKGENGNVRRIGINKANGHNMMDIKWCHLFQNIYYALLGEDIEMFSPTNTTP